MDQQRCPTHGSGPLAEKVDHATDTGLEGGLSLNNTNAWAGTLSEIEPGLNGQAQGRGIERIADALDHHIAAAAAQPGHAVKRRRTRIARIGERDRTEAGAIVGGAAEADISSGFAQHLGTSADENADAGWVGSRIAARRSRQLQVAGAGGPNGGPLLEGDGDRLAGAVGGVTTASRKGTGVDAEAAIAEQLGEIGHPQPLADHGAPIRVKT